MQVEAAVGYPCPYFFFVGGRVVGGTPPVEAVGVLIVKQTIAVTGPAVPQQPVLLSDVPPSSPMQFESDLVPVKPSLDVVAVRTATNATGPFGTVAVRRGATFGLSVNLDFGWRSRTAQPGRRDEAGNVTAFTPATVTDPAHPPPLLDRLKLPANFNNSFFNGGRVAVGPPLVATDAVRFTPTGAASVQVTIPAAPRLTIDRVTSAPAISVAADTVVYDITGTRFLVTWRGIFPWSAALEAPTARLMVA